MLDGTYAVEVNTPLGQKMGKINVTTNGDKAYVEVDAPVLGKKMLEGKCDGDSFIVEGEWKILLVGKVQYSVKGTVYGEDIALEVKTSKGNTKAVGVRI